MVFKVGGGGADRAKNHNHRSVVIFTFCTQIWRKKSGG